MIICFFGSSFILVGFLFFIFYSNGLHLPITSARSLVRFHVETQIPLELHRKGIQCKNLPKVALLSHNLKIFFVRAPPLLNSLPQEVRLVSFLSSSFKSVLKTCFCKRAFSVPPAGATFTSSPFVRLFKLFLFL